MALIYFVVLIVVGASMARGQNGCRYFVNIGSMRRPALVLAVINVKEKRKYSFYDSGRMAVRNVDRYFHLPER